MNKLIILLSVCLAALGFVPVVAQTRFIKGQIEDRHNEEKIPFVSVRLKKSGQGVQSDSAGNFFLRIPYNLADTLEITSVGYEDYFYAIPSGSGKDTLLLKIAMIPGKLSGEVVVRKKANKGLQMWKRIVRKKAENDRYRFDNFSYELYNKLELDLKNIDGDRMKHSRLLKPFGFVFDNMDSSEGNPYLPAYLTESISHYYYQKNPLLRREVFRGVKTIGFNNESVSKLLGGMDQVVNVYNNFIPVFDKEFVSPISDHGDQYYNYRVADTQYVAGKRLIHFIFSPRHKGQNTFEGDCWIHDTTYAVQKMNLRLDASANVNFVERLSLIQEYSFLDSLWFLSKDKFVVDITPLSKNKLSFIGRKTTTYRNVLVNDSSIVVELAKNKKKEETVLPPGSSEKAEEFWSASRHEQLSASEQSIYHMVDTLTNLPAFQRYARTLEFIGTGYLDIGNYEIGPWQNWITSNTVEGLRLRFDLGTNRHFSKKVLLHGYAAYGFRDRKWKGEFDIFYLFDKDPRKYVYASFLNDFESGQSYYDEISADNIFALAIRKSGVPIKFIRLKETRIDGFREFNSGISVMLSARHREFRPVLNLPIVDGIRVKDGLPMTGAETSLRLRYAYLEKFLENDFYRSSLGSPLPIIEVKYTKGLSGIIGSKYDYQKVSGSVSNYSNIPPLGDIYFNVFAGKTFGTLPYVFLDVAPGNEIYYYNKYAFNMMTRYEFLHDRYAGIHFEHNFGNGVFRYMGFTRKLKFRQFWTAKTLWGSLSEENKIFNASPDYTFRSLNGHTYLELGTGVDNIFRFLRVDFVWRALPGKSIAPSSRFGVFGSFRFSF